MRRLDGLFDQLLNDVGARNIFLNARVYGDNRGSYRLGLDITGMFPVSRDTSNLAIVEFDYVMARQRP